MYSALVDRSSYYTSQWHPASCWWQISPDVHYPGRQNKLVYFQQGVDIQDIMGEGVHGGDPSQEGSMVMQPEVSLNALTQRHQHHLLKC